MWFATLEVVVKASDVGFVEVRSNGTCQFDFFS